MSATAEKPTPAEIAAAKEAERRRQLVRENGKKKTALAS